LRREKDEKALKSIFPAGESFIPASGKKIDTKSILKKLIYINIIA